MKNKWFGLIPASFFLILFFLLPSFIFISRSVFNPHFTLENYYHLIKEPVYFEVVYITFKIASIVTILSFILGYPLAYFLYKSDKKKKWMILTIILLPFWTSLLVRTFAFMLLLQNNGIVNRTFIYLGFISTPLQMVNNFVGVIIGMTYMLLPYMILSIYSVMDRIDPNIEKVAQGLGAGRIKAFFTTILPLSAPGVFAGSTIVFLLGIGFFVTPALLGGRKQQMISMIIETQVNELLNWGFAATLSVMLIVCTLFLGSLLVLLTWITAKRTNFISNSKTV